MPCPGKHPDNGLMALLLHLSMDVFIRICVYVCVCAYMCLCARACGCVSVWVRFCVGACMHTGDSGAFTHPWVMNRNEKGMYLFLLVLLSFPWAAVVPLPGPTNQCRQGQPMGAAILTVVCGALSGLLLSISSLIN